MASIGKSGGQRGNTGSASGRKERSPTSSSHAGSRSDPSHVTEKSRNDRAKKAAARTKVTAKSAAKKKKKK